MFACVRVIISFPEGNISQSHSPGYFIKYTVLVSYNFCSRISLSHLLHSVVLKLFRYWSLLRSFSSHSPSYPGLSFVYRHSCFNHVPLRSFGSHSPSYPGLSFLYRHSCFNHVLLRSFGSHSPSYPGLSFLYRHSCFNHVLWYGIASPPFSSSCSVCLLTPICNLVMLCWRYCNNNGHCINIIYRHSFLQVLLVFLSKLHCLYP